MDERESARKAWHRPELTVLVRGRQEEAVLDTCKYSPYQGPQFDYTVCHGLEGQCGTGCLGYVAS